MQINEWEIHTWSTCWCVWSEVGGQLEEDEDSLAMVQLILPLPEPMQVQSQIMPSLGLS